MNSKLIVGLGNPGPKYSETRHNIGFKALDLFAAKHADGSRRSKFESEWTEVDLFGARVFLCWPQTFMNLSGRAVISFLRYFKIDLQDLAVVHDEMDLDLGRLKIVREAGPAGHRGVFSVQEAAHSKQFCRFRIGVKRPASKAQVVDYVLSDFSLAEKEVLDPVLRRVVAGLDLWIEQGVDAAIRFCHQPWS